MKILISLLSSFLESQTFWRPVFISSGSADLQRYIKAWLLALLNNFFFIGGKFFLNIYILLTYNVSGAQQGDSVIHIHLLFQLFSIIGIIRY